jgi:hypothetical protein
LGIKENERVVIHPTDKIRDGISIRNGDLLELCKTAAKEPSQETLFYVEWLRKIYFFSFGEQQISVLSAHPEQTRA